MNGRHRAERRRRRRRRNAAEALEEKKEEEKNMNGRNTTAETRPVELGYFCIATS
jgi:hypothetical protein